jgi:hypothetical protein
VFATQDALFTMKKTFVLWEIGNEEILKPISECRIPEIYKGHAFNYLGTLLSKTSIVSLVRENKTLIVFDMKSCSVLEERTFENDILIIKSSQNFMIVEQGNFLDIYSWKDSKMEINYMLIRGLRFNDISQSDIISFAKFGHYTTLCFSNATTQETFPEIDIGYTYWKSLITADASKVIVQEVPPVFRYSIYDTKTKELLYQSAHEKYLMAFSDDGLSVFFRDFAAKGTIIYHDFDVEISKRYLFSFNMLCGNVFVFGKINGTEHFICFYKSVLRLYKLNIEKKSWDLLE